MTRPLALVAMVMAVFLWAGCSQEEPSPAQLIAEAKQLHAKGQPRAAAILLRNALQKDPANGEAAYYLGVVYAQAGEGDAAEKELRKALAANVDAAQIAPHLARSLLLQRKFQQLLDETALVPAAAEIHGLRGRAQLALGRREDARSSFQYALKADPGALDALLGQTVLAATEKDLKAALGFVERALATAPRNVEAWLFKGDLLRSSADQEQTLAAYGRALEIEPGNVIAHVRRASIYLNSGKLDAAKAEIDAARKSNPRSPYMNYMQALLDFHKRDYIAARNSVERALRVIPDHMPSVLLAGVVQRLLGSWQSAEQHLRRFLGEYPENLFARRLLASTLLKSQQGGRALEVIQVGLKQAPDDPELMTLAGEAYAQVKDHRKAIEYLSRAVSVAPKSAALRARLGIAHLGAGETELALKELESAAELDLGGTRAETILILTLLDARQYDRAVAAALKLQKDRKDPAALNLLGAAYLGKKDRVNARKSFEAAVALKPDYAPAMMNLAQLDLETKRYDSARKRFQSILDKDRKNIQAMVGLSKLERSLRNRKEAVAWLEKARAENPFAMEPGLLLVDYYLRNKETQKALQIATDLKVRHPEHPDVLNALGRAQFESGAKVSAVATYKELAAKLPDSPDALYHLATAEMAAENYQAAAESLKRALRLRPDYFDAQAALALLEYRAGRHPESIKLAQQLQKRYPKVAVGYSLEGDNLIAQKKFAAAEKSFEKAFGIEKSGNIAVKLHMAAVGADRNVKQADERLQEWVKGNPNDLRAQLYLANYYVNSGLNKNAIELYESVLKKDPRNALALNNLGSLYNREKDPRALSHLEQAYKLMPDSALIADNLGWLLVEQGNFPRGVEVLRKAASLAPENYPIRYHLAVALEKSGDKVQAAKEKEKAEALLKK